MMTGMDIVEFLTARYNEDEAARGTIHDRECSSLDWAPGAGAPCDCGHPLHFVGTCERDEPVDPCDCGQPARMLADIAAKRRRLALHQRHDADPHIHMLPWCEFCTYLDYDGDEERTHIESWPCLHLRIDTSPYDEHADYDPAWTLAE